MDAIAPDGSPVGLYLALAPLGEPELIHAAVPPASEILELGCGTGRITRPLVALGHAVTAVDNSPEMLSHVRGAETVLADIELDAVLATCARHVAPGGRVLLERMPPEWQPPEESREAGGVRITLRDFETDGARFSAVMEYEAGGERWTQPFTARLLSDDATEAALVRAGLRRTRWLDERRSWLEAAPA